MVVDASNAEQIDQTSRELAAVMQDLGKCPILILANKIDVPGALTASEVAAKMDLYNLMGDRVWGILVIHHHSSDN